MFPAVLATAMLIGGALIGMPSQAQAQGLVQCARENGFCRVPYPTRVIYGIRGQGVEVFVRGGGVPCTNRVFGDPAPGVAKRCFYIARGSERGPRRYEERPRRYDDGYRRSFREYDRGYEDYEDDGYDRPFRSYEVY
ncbi:hypothetical protein [Microvirga splendida]|uniref:Uncharacterized protein n=1 Tax=Microvirga splendida TaxID=2795727 RepID=A0ABS0Y151_9HYPH|nr:hypothetical protein [Microvirga splendida]MBJ6125745.1 hypothetical protein [Microvirga splendida]